MAFKVRLASTEDTALLNALDKEAGVPEFFGGAGVNPSAKKLEHCLLPLIVLETEPDDENGPGKPTPVAFVAIDDRLPFGCGDIEAVSRAVQRELVGTAIVTVS
jgi:hypothetical protein